ncbi:endo alpha-1,4 polygalactosaminidase [Microbacterium sp. 18062]|uniref:endo alpha-1,4 polygalactosaminidase n=1 Tax=Microbacterium sp. 18062 TaxID=2681410 RepID=UPI001F2FCFDF|nr:endo alpha-1,4 polygalactosaminidase [Microbacterium sp. 18062]
MSTIRSLAVPIACVLVVVVAGCVASVDTQAPADAPRVVLPPSGALPDYQLGGAYDPDPRAGIVVRDRTERPVPDVYSICYVNGFQTQPGERDDWPDDLVLRRDGADVVDPEWPDEALLDTGTDAARAAIAQRVGGWIQGCAQAGFDGVEFDNLDSYTRSEGALSLEDNLELARLLVQVAHTEGLAAAQKNAAEDAARLHRDAGFDVAIAEECAAYEECPAYTQVYGEQVVAIEYTDNERRPFEAVCADDATPRSVVLRDRDLVTPADEDYVLEWC